MSESKLILRCIDDLLQEDFYIPDYQRGFRWSTVQVKTLLEDVWKFRQDSDEAKKEVFYCLQPIVAAPGDQGWIVIDGQQRLTTIHLILTFLEPFLGRRARRNFGLAYQTRPDSEQYLKNPDPDKAQENPDYYHMYEAYKTIENWFKEKSGNTEINFVQTLLNSDEEGKNVKVIWYEVAANGANHIDIFTRLNIGKIPLTNAELIKALLLQKSNFDEDAAHLKQIQIATEWDNIERTLHQSEFWYFIYDTANPFRYENRIEYIFDLMYDRQIDEERFHTFYKFNKEAQQLKAETGKMDVDALWLNVKRYFLTFDEWYNDRELYHLIGFLVACGDNINSLKQASRDKKKDEFRNHLHNEIRKHVNYDVEHLEYHYSSDRLNIRKVLLLFNIQTLMINKGADMRFPFDRYKKENWDIEHIRSQTEMEIKGDKQQKAWINDVLDYLTGHSVSEFIDEDDGNLIENCGLDPEVLSLCEQMIEYYQQEDPDTEVFNGLRVAVEKHFRERSTDGDNNTDDIDTIGNLALLDENTNRSYKNALFPIKRKKIIEKDSVGKFVPICTKNVFLKYYSNQFDDLMYWKESDAKAYQDAIIETLTDYLPKTEDENE